MAYSITCPMCKGDGLIVFRDGTIGYHCMNCKADVDELQRERPLTRIQANHASIAYTVLSRADGKIRYLKEKSKLVGFDGKRWDLEYGDRVFHETYMAVMTDLQTEANKKRHEIYEKVVNYRQSIGFTKLDVTWEVAETLQEKLDPKDAAGRAACEQVVALDDVINKMKSNGFVENVKKFMVNYTSIYCSLDDFDGETNLLNVRNGVLDLDTGLLTPHTPTVMCTMCASTDWVPGATSKVWEDFLLQTFGTPDLIAWMQKALGYALSADVGEDCFFVCWGTGANGKSVLMNVLQGILGDYAATASFTTFSERAGRSEARNDLAALRGARFVVASESDQTTTLDMAALKGITGGEPVRARFLYSEFFEYVPAYKIFLSTNLLPTIKSNDEGSWRRIKTIPFLNTVPKTKRVRNYHKILLKDSAAILYWLWEGYRRWTVEGLGGVQAVDNLINMYRLEQDMIGPWWDDLVVPVPGYKEFQSSVYDSYVKWCEGNNVKKPLSQRAFTNKLLSERHITWVAEGRNRFYVGLTIRPGIHDLPLFVDEVSFYVRKGSGDGATSEEVARWANVEYGGKYGVSLTAEDVVSLLSFEKDVYQGRDGRWRDVSKRVEEVEFESAVPDDSDGSKWEGV